MRINRMGTSFGESMLEQECHSVPDIFVYGIRTLLLILHSFYKSSFVETDHWHILRSFLILQVSSIRTTSYVPTRSSAYIQMLVLHTTGRILRLLIMLPPIGSLSALVALHQDVCLEIPISASTATILQSEQNKIARLYAGEQFCYCIEVI